MAIQIRRGTNTEWESNNSNIVVGEPAIATDAERFFVGTASGDYAEFANLDIIAPAYDTSTSYVVGDVVNRQGKLYSCNAPCSGTFNASYWDEKSLAEILKDLENEITYAQYEIGYASGELITIDNGASEIPVKDLTLDIEAVQDLHGYDHPWVGGAGKNMITNPTYGTALSTVLDLGEDKTFSALTLSFTAENAVATGGVAAAMVDYRQSDGTHNYVTLRSFINENGVAFNQTNTPYNGRFRNTKENITFRYCDVYYMSMGYSKFSSDSLSDFMLELGSSATAYEPYSNICPISGWDEANVCVAGKNLVESIKTAFVSPSTGYAEYTTGISGTVLVFKCVARQAYTISGVNGNRLIYAIYDSMPTSSEHSTFFENLSSGITFPKTITPQKTGVCVVAVANTQIDTSTAQIELGSTATAYEPYNGQTYTTDLDGTRYGGTLDVTTGVLTISHGYVDLGSLDWVANARYSNTFNGTSLNPRAKFVDNITTWKCSDYASYISTIVGTVDAGIAIGANKYIVYVRDIRFNDPATFKTAMSGVQLVYELDTPLTVQLTPTQVRTVLGTNNLWNQMNSNNELAYRISNALN